jgi:hypothetical protein
MVIPGLVGNLQLRVTAWGRDADGARERAAVKVKSVWSGSSAMGEGKAMGAAKQERGQGKD